MFWFIDLQPMTRRHESQGGMLKLRPAALGHRDGDVGIVLSPDELDRNVERLEFGKTLGVLGVYVKELSRQLHESWARAGLGDEVLAD